IISHHYHLDSRTTSPTQSPLLFITSLIYHRGHHPHFKYSCHYRPRILVLLVVTACRKLATKMRQDEMQKTVMWDKVKIRIPELLKNLETRITKQGWILSSEMTWVDVFVAAYLDTYDNYLPGTLAAAPKVKCLLEHVKAIPSIKTWIEERPDWQKFEEPEGLV
ncbi:hypothetical protein OTU49_010096, partial [Cherax quadricarinatus]